MCFGDEIRMKLYKKSNKDDTKHGCTKDSYESSIDVKQKYDYDDECAKIDGEYYKFEYVFSLDEGTDNI